MSKNTASSTQQHLPLAGIQDGVVIMNDGSVRCILKIEPINFDLKSQEEQNGIIYGYQGFLNSLEFPIQIVVHSKKLDLERYLVKLAGRSKDMPNDLLRIQLDDYVEFVRRLISIANIMAKRFYVVVDYGVGTKLSPSSFTGLFGKQATGPVLEQEQFDRFRAEVASRGNLVGQGLSRLGLTVRALDTQQLIELFYSIYNPDIATEERLTDISNLSAGVVSSGSDQNLDLDNPPSQPDQAPISEQATAGDNSFDAQLGIVPPPEIVAQAPTAPEPISPAEEPPLGVDTTPAPESPSTPADQPPVS